MDLTNIRTFLRVVELGSFAKAAEDLKYSQSTVTAQIQALEKELGVPLFDRIGRRNYLSDVGREFLQYAIDIQGIMQKASTIGSSSTEFKSTLRIGVLESILFSVILNLIPQLKKRYPNLDLDVKVDQTATLIQMLKQNELDVIYISSVINTDASLVCHYRKEEVVVFAANHLHPLANQKKIPLKTILQYPYIASETSGHCYNTLVRLAAAINQQLNCAIVINDLDAISILLRDNISITFLPKYSITSQYLQNNGLISLDVDIPPQIYYGQILTRDGRWISPPMESFIELAKDLTRPKEIN